MEAPAPADDAVRYVHHEARGRDTVPFVRPDPTDASGRTRPYFCVGCTRCVEHRAQRPLQITWELHDALPDGVVSALRAAVA